MEVLGTCIHTQIHMFVHVNLTEYAVSVLERTWIMSCSAQVYPSIDVLKTKVIKLDKEIGLPVLRNSDKLEAGDELLLYMEKKDKAQGEPLRAGPSKRLRKTWEIVSKEPNWHFSALASNLSLLWVHGVAWTAVFGDRASMCPSAWVKRNES